MLKANSAIRVLHVYRTYYPDSQGGLEEVIRQICLNTQDAGVESRVFALSPSPDPISILRPEGLVYRSQRSFSLASCDIGLFSLPLFTELVSWCDVIHYHFPWPFGDLLHLLVKVDKPAILTYHSDIVRQQFLSKLYRPLMRKFLKKINTIICTSPNYARSSYVLAEMSHKVQVIPIGIDDRLNELSDIDKDLGLIEIPTGNFFLFLGVLRYYKGLHTLLEAMKGQSLHCVVAGSGPLEKKIRRYADENNMENVQFLGSVDERVKLSLLRACSGLVLPSHLRSEAFGVVLVEAAMMGKPLISAEIGTGTSYVNLDGVTGIVVPPNSPEHLRKALLRLARNPGLAEKMGEAARSRYEAHFSGPGMGSQYAKVYQRVISPLY